MTKDQETLKKLKERQRNLKKQIASLASKRKLTDEELEKLNNLYNALHEVTDHIKYFNN